jgi:hypothetical protein
MVNDTRTEIEKQLGIEVVKREKIVSYRETVALRNKERIPEAIAHIHSQIRTGRVSGTVNVNVSQGGVVNVLTEQIAKVRLGSELDEQTDEAYWPDKVVDIQSNVA